MTKKMLTPKLGSLAAICLVMGIVVGCGSDSKTADNATGSSPTATTSASGGTTTSGDATAATKRPVPTAPTVVASGDTIKIGLVASLSGDQKPWGDDSRAGAEIAVAEVNAKGGVHGKKVELVVQDSASTSQGAKTAAEKLLSEGVIGIVGEVSSGNTIQIAHSAFEKSVPVVGIGSTRVDLTDIGSNVFRVCYSDAFQGPVMAKFAYEELGLKNVALMTDNKAPYSQGLSASFAETFKKLGGNIVAEEKYDTGQTQFGPQLTELKDKNPEGIFMSGYFPEVGPIAQQARAAGIKAKFLGGDGWDSPKLLESGGSAIIGGFLCNHYNNKETRPTVKAFLAKWTKSHNGEEPGTTMAALGYDAAALTLDALARAKSTDSKALIDAIDATENFHGVSGDITLKGQNGTPFKQALVVEVRSKAEGFQVPKKAYTPDQVK